MALYLSESSLHTCPLQSAQPRVITAREYAWEGPTVKTEPTRFTPTASRWTSSAGGSAHPRRTSTGIRSTTSTTSTPRARGSETWRPIRAARAARAQQLGNVARKLGGAIARSAKRRRENGDSDSESEEAATHRRGKNAGATGKKKGLPMGGAGSNTGASGPPKDASDSESDSDEGGRAAAFTKGAARNKKRAQPAVWDPTKDVKCVGNAPGAGTSKKARKKAARRLREAEAAAARGGKSVA